MAGRLLKAFLFLAVAFLVLVSLLILFSGEKYQLEVEAHFSSPLEFEGAEFMAGYPNEVTHVALFSSGAPAGVEGTFGS